MIRNFLERSPRLRNMFHRSPRQNVSELRVLPNEVHFNMLNQMTTPAEWKNYSEAYPHLAADDYFWKKLMIKFPELNLFECQDMNWVGAVNYILDHGGDVYQMDKRNEFFLFFTVVESKKFDMARLFLDRGFDINTKEGYYTVLINMVSQGDVESVNFLLEQGAGVNVVARKNKFSVLDMFCVRYDFKSGDNGILQLLTDYGADYNLKTLDDEVALHLLINRMYVVIFSMSPFDDISPVKRVFTLFIQKTDMSIVDRKGRTFLHHICIGYSNDYDRWFDEILDL